jgi:hypothetical protein
MRSLGITSVWKPIIALAAFAPYTVLAAIDTAETSRIEVILYGLIGFFGAAAVLVFVGGFTLYAVRFGTERRKEGLEYMIWSVSLILAVLFLIGIVRFFYGV